MSHHELPSPVEAFLNPAAFIKLWQPEPSDDLPAPVAVDGDDANELRFDHTSFNKHKNGRDSSSRGRDGKGDGLRWRW